MRALLSQESVNTHEFKTRPIQSNSETDDEDIEIEFHITSQGLL